MYYYGWGHGFGFLSLLWPLLWVVLIIALFKGFGRWGRHSDEESAEKILRERFARGEIKEKEYRERLQVLCEQSK